MAAPVLLFGILGGIMWFTGFYKKNGRPDKADSVEKGDQ
jgi:hypothetical protein